MTDSAGPIRNASRSGHIRLRWSAATSCRRGRMSLRHFRYMSRTLMWLSRS